MDATGAVGAVYLACTIVVTGTVGAVSSACITDVGPTTISISRSIWLWVAIDACSFKGQVRLLLVWPCLWHAEHVGSCFVGSSPAERIRPVCDTRIFPVRCLPAYSGSRSGCKVLLRSQYQCSWKSVGIRLPVALRMLHICAQGKPIDWVKLPVQGCSSRETSSRCRCKSRSACHITTPKQPWYSFLSIFRGVRSCCIVVRLDTAVIWFITAASISSYDE
jgi:hypothetical protein